MLVEDVTHLGKSGDIVEVKPGYARNYLLPYSMATVPSAHNLRLIERYKIRLMQAREARIVIIDDHLTDIPPSEHMLVVTNDDRPGAIGRVATTLGNADINIDNMDVGTTATAGSALMCIATSIKVPEQVLDSLRQLPGIFTVVAIGA